MRCRLWFCCISDRTNLKASFLDCDERGRVRYVYDKRGSHELLELLDLFRFSNLQQLNYVRGFESHPHRHLFLINLRVEASSQKQLEAILRAIVHQTERLLAESLPRTHQKLHSEA
jgi:hypothetical protein